MYKYRVGYGSYEESCYREFCHEDKLSGQQLNTIVADCVAEAALLDDQASHLTTFQQFMPDNVRFIEAMYRRGFVQTVYEAHSCVFGWNSILEPDWERDLDEEDLRIVRHIRRRLAGKTWRANLEREMRKKHSYGDYILFAKSREEAMQKAKKVFGRKTSRGILLKRWSPKNNIRLPKEKIDAQP